MTTVLQYLVIAAVVAAVLFGIALLVFGRGEQMSALPARTSPVDLPDRNISGDDVRGVRFALAARGYRMSDVDWALERLADELDRVRVRLAEVTGDVPDAGRDPADPNHVDLFAADDPLEPANDPTAADEAPADAASADAASADSAPDNSAPGNSAPDDAAPDDDAEDQPMAARILDPRAEAPASATPSDTDKR